MNSVISNIEQRRQPNLLVRFQHTTWGPYSPVSNQTCAVVSSTGRFHIEKNKRDASTRASQIDVFEGSLTTEEQHELGSLLESEPVRSIKEQPDPRSYATIGGTNDLLIVEIRHGKDFQQFALLSDEAWQRNGHLIKPVFEWLKSMEKRKMKPTKDAPTSRCIDLPKEAASATLPDHLK